MYIHDNIRICIYMYIYIHIHIYNDFVLSRHVRTAPEMAYKNNRNMHLVFLHFEYAQSAYVCIQILTYDLLTLPLVVDSIH
jgi:hypothetical protein